MVSSEQWSDVIFNLYVSNIPPINIILAVNLKCSIVTILWYVFKWTKCDDSCHAKAPQYTEYTIIHSVKNSDLLPWNPNQNISSTFQ